MATLKKLKSHPIAIEAQAKSVPPPFNVIKTDVKGHLASSYDLGALEGLRAVAALAIICFHCFLYWGTLLPLPKGHKAMGQSFPLRMAMHGNAGVDVFLVLTGLWATIHLVPALEVASLSKSHDGAWLVIKQYFKKRVLRVMPPYLTSLMLVAFAIDHSAGADPALRRNHDTVFEYCPGSLPLNFVLLNNLVGFGGCGVHFWSLAVQLHFYLTFPFVLLTATPSRKGFRSRLIKGAIATIIPCAALRIAVARAVGVKLPLTPYAHPDLSPAGADLAMRYYHSMYFPTPARAANLATGVLLALVMLDAKATAALKRHRWAVLLACAAALGVFGRLVLASKLYGTPKEEVNWPNAAMFAALAYHGSPLYCAAAAAVVLGLALHVGPGFTAAAKVLASGPMHLLSKISYDMYLLHMAALYWWEAYTVHKGTLEAAVAANPLAGYGIILLGTCAAGLAVAVAHNLFHSKLQTLFGGKKTKEKVAKA